VASRKAYGRAFPIRKADVGAYRMAQRPNGGGYRPNPMGVTTLASVNGPGAYSRAHSARAATHGLSRAERVARARRLMENRSGSMESNKVHRAAFVRRMNENRGRTRRGGRARFEENRRPPTAAESKLYAAGYEGIFGGRRRRRSSKKPRKSKAAKAAPAKRRYTSKGVKAAERAVKAAEKRLAKAQTAQKRTAERAALAKKNAELRLQKEKERAAKRNTPEAKARRRRAAIKKKWPKQTRTLGRGKKARRARVAYGPYRRASLTHPRRGGRVLSYMTRRGGKLRKIPAWAIAGAISPKDYKTEGAYQKAKERIAKRRKAAAKRAEAGWDAFTPNAGAGRMNENKGRKKRKKRKSSRRKKAGGKSRRRRTKRTSARRGRRRSKKRAVTHRRRRRAARKTTVRRRRRSTARKAAPRRRRRRSTARKTTTRRRRRSTARKTTARRRRVRGVPRRVGRRRVRRLKRGLYLVTNRRRRHYEENRRRSRSIGRYMKNGFVGDLTSLLKTGALVLTGFFVHKALTGVLVNALTSKDGKFAGMDVVGSDGKQTILGQWQRPLTGAVVGAVGIAGVSMVPGMKAETRMSIGAGMMVSWLENLVKTALTAAGQPQALTYLEGYSNSSSYDLRGTGRYRPRHLRGLGVARNAVSIMPQWAQVGAVDPQFQQAHAGMGEYFKPMSGMGEYFAGPGTQGVGFYEKAGPLALMPGRSHMGQLPVDDGIRPDANLDHILDLAESAAGLGQTMQAVAGNGAGPRFRSAAAGLGEFFTASPSNGGFSESTVPTESQWIPNGPLWAGNSPADAHYTESELPAGILQGPGGNGVLSGG